MKEEASLGHFWNFAYANAINDHLIVKWLHSLLSNLCICVLKGNSSILKPGPYVDIFGWIYDSCLPKVLELVS